MGRPSNVRAHFFFWVLLLVVSWSYNYQDILPSGPRSIHQWRQADCLSITQNFYMENRPFLEPAIHWVGDADGRTISECPIIYYSVAKLWQWFGKEYWVFRTINILLVFIGLWSLFRITLRVTSESYWAIFLPLFLFSSPILAYYSNNFMADAPALGLALTGGYLAYLGVMDRKKWAYYLAFGVFLIAGLIKISSMILFIALGIWHLWSALRGRLRNDLVHWTAWVPYLIVVTALFLWYRYSNQFNSENVDGIFLTGLFPIWELNGDQIRDIWNSLSGELLPAFFTTQGLWLLGILFVGLLGMARKVNDNWLGLTVILAGGLAGFILLFYQAFTVHDYYLTNLLIFIPVLLLAVLDTVKKQYQNLLKNRWVKIVAGLILALFIYKTALTNRMKYSAEDPWLQYNFVVGQGRIDFWKWFHEDYEQHMKPYETITGYLRSLGIDREDRVLSFSDNSINITLYLMDQKGFSSFGYQALSLEDKMKVYRDNGVRYIIVDENSDDVRAIESYLGAKMGQYENVGIYYLAD